MIPTVSQVYTQARSWIGDDNPLGTQVFTDAILQPKFVMAYSELYRALQKMQNPRIFRTYYYNVPAYTAIVVPATMGIANLGEIETIDERGGTQSVSINAVTPSASSCLIQTSSAHPFQVGFQAVLFGIEGVSDNINDIWTVTAVPSSTRFTIGGAVVTGTYTASTGTASYSAQGWSPVTRIDYITQTENSPEDMFRVFQWSGDVIRFPAANAIRQIRVQIQLSGDAPTATTASVGIDDSLDFLSLRTAALAFASKNGVQRAATLNNLAVGPAWESQGIAGGILGQLLDAGVRQLQALPSDYLRAQPFRQRRSWNTIF